ncbi:SMP-30/gluconolactonase/LRE family protein [Streptomyces sp. NPDC006288]|uniref:SMP-30/gluconolactonase/LRE family protein n=1 Tax=Streptomyces sp. NPDC006288 TaxID=3156743 RepID=UPI0033A3287D
MREADERPVAYPSRFDGTRPGGDGPATGRRPVQRLNPANPLWGSNGIAFGPDGRLYVAEFLGGRISAVDLDAGELDVVVPAGGPVESPDDLAFGADGSMYVADLVPGRVWRRSPQGEYSLVCDEVQNPNGITCIGDRLFVNEMKPDGRLLELFPDGGEPAVLTGGLALGNAMQRGPDGWLYYPHMVSGQVWRIPPDGGEPELVADQVELPVAVRFDLAGVLHVLSLGPEGRVTRIDLHGTGSRTVVSSGVAGLDNAAFDAENRMFVSSYATGGITEMHPDGRTRVIVPRGFDGPYGVTVDLGGTVYAADHYRVAGPPAAEEDKRDAAGAEGPVSHVLAPFAHGIAADGDLLHLTSQFGDVRTYDPGEGTMRTRVVGLRRPMGIAVGPAGALVVAESGGGRILSVAEDDTVTVLAEGLGRPVDVAFDAAGRCYVSDERAGTVVRLEEDAATTVVADGLGAPQGLTVVGDTLYTVETGRRRLRAVSLTTSASWTEAEDLPVGVSPGAGHRQPEAEPALFANGLPGLARRFAGIAAAPDGSLVLSANGEGTLLRLTPSGPPE